MHVCRCLPACHHIHQVLWSRFRFLVRCFPLSWRARAELNGLPCFCNSHVSDARQSFKTAVSVRSFGKESDTRKMLLSSFSITWSKYGCKRRDSEVGMAVHNVCGTCLSVSRHETDYKMCASNRYHVFHQCNAKHSHIEPMSMADWRQLNFRSCKSYTWFMFDFSHDRRNRLERRNSHIKMLNPFWIQILVRGVLLFFIYWMGNS